MRISIAISLLILAVGAAVGWQDHQRLAAVKAEHAKLVAEAGKFGIVLDPANTEGGILITKRERENKEADAKKIAVEFIAFAKEMEAIEKSGNPPDEAMQQKTMAILERMMSLDAAQLKILIAEVRASTDLKNEMRQGLLAFAIMSLAEDHPQAALTVFTETSDLFKDGMMGTHVISSSLAKWAKDDPLAALEWVRKNGEKFPDLVNDQAKRGMISGAAANDPKLAFQLISELGLKDHSDAISSIISVAKTPEDRTATLGALRDYLVTLKDEQSRGNAASNALRELARGVAGEGFEAGTKWIAAANLTKEELKNITSGLSNHAKPAETGQWIEWLGETFPNGESNHKIRSQVSNWTQSDYQAAGKWLATTPDGPVKNVSIRAYAETISRYEPETAAQWAMTLPPGNERDDTLKEIYSKWPKDDAAAKEAFKQQHGIK